MQGRRKYVSLAACAALCSLLLITACSTLRSAAEAPSFAGSWVYADTCGHEHYLALGIEQEGDIVSGTWTEQTRRYDITGRLQGDVRSGRLHVRYCSDDVPDGFARCPRFDGSREDRFVREGSSLVRHRSMGAGYQPDLALHPAAAGTSGRTLAPCNAEGYRE